MRKKSLQLVILIFIAITFISGCGNPSEKEKFKVTLPDNDTNDNPVDWQNIYQANIQSIPMIVFEKCYVVADYCFDYGHGTGFVVADNVVATNYHIADYFFLKETVTLPADTVYYQVYAKYPATNSLDDNYFLPEKYYVTGVHSLIDRDLALLQVDTLNNYPVRFTPDDFTDLAVDDLVMIISYPGFNEFVGSAGKISYLTLNENWVDWVAPDTKIIEFTADTNNGSSGGPVFNDQGKVMGVDFAYYINEENKIIPLAISIDHLKNYDFSSLVFETK